MFQAREYIFKPYEYEKNGKKKVGIWITETTADTKIESVYQDFKQNADGTWTITNLLGYPEFDGNPKDSDDLKIYFLKATKFLREQALKHIRDKFSNATIEQHPPEVEAKNPEDDSNDVPF
jgi:hypothetical protein